MIKKRYKMKGIATVTLNPNIGNRELTAGNTLAIKFTDGHVIIDVTNAVPIEETEEHARPLRRLDDDRCQTNIG